jgi:hypothetical protein
MNIYRNMTSMAVVVCIGVLLLTGVALAQDVPDILPETGAASSANTYISHLDDLRAMGQPQAERTSAAAANYSSYEFSSDLTALHEMALAKAAAGRSANTVPTANDYITTLDQLRSTGAK